MNLNTSAKKIRERVIEHFISSLTKMERLTEKLVPECLRNQLSATEDAPCASQYLQAIFQRIGVESKTFLEFGHAFLTCQNREFETWSGVHLTDDDLCLKRALATYRNRQVACLFSHFDAAEYRETLHQARISPTLDLLILCLQGREYDLWESLSDVSPRVVCILYNASFLPWQDFLANRPPSSVWLGDREFSASLKSLNRLAQHRGYKLVGCSEAGHYAFFVREDLVDQHFALPGCVAFHYRCPKYRYGEFGYPRHLSPESNLQTYLNANGEPPRLRVGSWDHDIWNSVTREYVTLPEKFLPTDVVLDIGAHVGAFSSAASVRGEPIVLAFEANLENYQLASQNLACFPQCSVQNLAVWRSDEPSRELLFTPHPIGLNTGGGTVLTSRCPDSGHSSSYLRPQTVDTISLDDILKSHKVVRYLKIDAEGSEFPILYTSKLLDRVVEIAGEYHEGVPGQDCPTPLETSRKMEHLARHLRAQGFSIVWRETSPGLGLFFASREKVLNQTVLEF